MNIDLTGHVYGRLTVISRELNSPVGKTRWLCKCSCGTETVVVGNHMRTGNTKSCGCYHREHAGRLGARNVKHGQAREGKRSPEYTAWYNMWSRCTNTNLAKWANYGGRGIRVCPEWRDFVAFLKHIGPRPAPWMSLDRIDNDGHYEPDNVRWATRKTQNKNRRSWGIVR
jgi:hypothetical protein